MIRCFISLTHAVVNRNQGTNPRRFLILVAWLFGRTSSKRRALGAVVVIHELNKSLDFGK